MFIDISLWGLAGVAFIAWVIQVLMSAKQPDSLLEYEWEELKKVFVNQANRLVYLAIELPISWFLNSYVLFGFDLSILTWVIRVHAAFVALTEITIFFVSVASVFRRQPWMWRAAVSSLAVFAASALIALAV